MIKFTIPGRLPGVNDIIAESKKGRGKYQPYAKIKREHTEEIAWIVKAKYSKSLKEPVTVCVKWYEPNYRRDIDNIAGGVKFILDGLVMAGVLENDSQKHVKGIKHTFSVDRENPRVEVTLRS